MDSAQVREELVDALRLDIVGPEAGSPLESEILVQPPSRWYLTGFLVPYEAKEEQRTDPAASEQLDMFGSGGGTDDDGSPEKASARKAFFPSSIGASVLVPGNARTLRVQVAWGDYGAIGSGETASTPTQWRRTQRSPEMKLDISAGKMQRSHPVPESGGLRLVLTERPVSPRLIGRADGLVRKGTRSLSVFLVNNRRPQEGELKDQASAFQAGLTLRIDQPFEPRPNLRGLDTEDTDERTADLQYRDDYEFAVGHGVSTRAVVADGRCTEVATTWVPTAEVERVEPREVEGVELSMETLGELASAEEARTRLGALPRAYQTWLEGQRGTAPKDGRRGEVATGLLQRAEAVRRRMEDGLGALADPMVLDAFRTANRAMAAAARQRFALAEGKDPKDVAAPRWHPFQIAFLLMNLRGLAEPTHPDREMVDLLFFPTGGGKTEAYLGLAAFTLVLRRLRNPGISSSGVSVLMRYTLRLLTLDQLSRAATLICALELERRKTPSRLGEWPFEIGLWVGKGATPNRMGELGDGDDESARAKTIRYQNNSRKSAPIPLENCPWCGERFTPASFHLQKDPKHPTDLRIGCKDRSRRCPFRGNPMLPILAVDEPIYRRLPCFLIATVDKFAGLPWFGRVGALFGKVERFDKEGFYGPCDPEIGGKLDHPLLPPDLVIQDELHLISGPLGTLVGLYETAIDALCTRREGDRRIRPKVIASTATVRRADAQVRALFARQGVEVFPPPGPDRRDSFFAVTVPRGEKKGRLYVGVAAQGRSLKVLLKRSYLVLLAAAQRAYTREGGDKKVDNPADPYMTLLGYFNSLRELGGSRRIVEDEVHSGLRGYADRRRVGEAQGTFVNREIDYEVVELTSRESTGKVAIAKRRLARSFREDDAVDVALATNMISVGLDILRLGLMVVLGQPMKTAEYIQATSRVGRKDGKPGLVLTLLNVHRPRDRSHYERFEAYHASFYRGVEASSVTPFSPRAVDRGLAAIVVGLARHGLTSLTPSRRAVEMGARRSEADFVAEAIALRSQLATAEGDETRQKLLARVGDLLDGWGKIAGKNQEVGADLRYNRSEEGSGQSLLVDPLDPALPTLPPAVRVFKAHRSLRDVEPSVNLWMDRIGEGVEEREE